MNEEQKYLYDLNGYVVLENVSSDHDRINLFYKYNHAGVKWHAGFPPDAVLAAMTPSQRVYYADVSNDPRVPPTMPAVGDRWRALLPGDLRNL